MPIRTGERSTAVDQLRELAKFFAQRTLQYDSAYGQAQMQSGQIASQAAGQATAAFGSSFNQGLDRAAAAEARKQGIKARDAAQGNDWAQKLGFPDLASLQAAQVQSGQDWPTFLNDMAVQQQTTGANAAEAWGLNLTPAENTRRREVMAQLGKMGLPPEQVGAGVDQIISQLDSMAPYMPGPLRTQVAASREALANLDIPEYASKFTPPEQAELRRELERELNGYARQAQGFLPKKPTTQGMYQNGDLNFDPRLGGTWYKTKDGLKFQPQAHTSSAGAGEDVLERLRVEALTDPGVREIYNQALQEDLDSRLRQGRDGRYYLRGKNGWEGVKEEPEESSIDFGYGVSVPVKDLPKFLEPFQTYTDENGDEKQATPEQAIQNVRKMLKALDEEKRSVVLGAVPKHEYEQWPPEVQHAAQVRYHFKQNGVKDINDQITKENADAVLWSYFEARRPFAPGGAPASQRAVRGTSMTTPPPTSQPVAQPAGAQRPTGYYPGKYFE